MEINSVMTVKEMPLSNQLRIKRILERKTQAELSKQLGIAQPTISKYELNLREIIGNDLQTIVDYLEK